MISLVEFLRSFSASLTYALRGLVFASRSQRNVRIHLFCAGAALLAAALLGFQRGEWVALLLTIGLVLLGELINTAVEFALNLVEARDHPVVRTAKDIAAGGVVLVVVISVVIGLLLFGPHLSRLAGGGR